MEAVWKGGAGRDGCRQLMLRCSLKNAAGVCLWQLGVGRMDTQTTACTSVTGIRNKSASVAILREMKYRYLIYSYSEIILRHYSTLLEMRKSQKDVGDIALPQPFNAWGFSWGEPHGTSFPRCLLQKEQISAIVEEKKFMFPVRYHNNKFSSKF